MSGARIDRRTFLSLVGAAAALPGAGCDGSDDGAYDVVLVTVDQLRCLDRLPPGFVLPNVERLRARGVTFTNHTITAAPCTPSRATLYTGQHAPRTGMIDNVNFPFIRPMSTDVVTLGHRLEAAGVHAVYRGKWHLGGVPETGVTTDALRPYGFAEYSAGGDHHGVPFTGLLFDGGVAEDAGAFLSTVAPTLRARDQRFFLAVNFVNPHDIMFVDTDAGGTTQSSGGVPVFAPPTAPPYDVRHGLPLPTTRLQSFDGRPAAHAEFRDVFDRVFGSIPTDREDLWQVYQDYYLNCALDVDTHLGTVLDALELAGLDETTVVVFLSDHGELGGAHGLRQKGPVCYRENVTVPMVIAHPAHRTARSVATPTSHLDLVPTILGLFGVRPEDTRGPTLPGVDLSPTVRGGDVPAARRRRGALFTYDAIDTLDAAFAAANAADWVRDPTACPVGAPDFTKRGFVRARFDGRYRFARSYAPIEPNRPADVDALFASNDVELYDTLTDPDELVNLAAEGSRDAHRALLEAQRSALEAALDEELGDDRTPFDGPLC